MLPRTCVEFITFCRFYFIWSYISWIFKDLATCHI